MPLLPRPMTILVVLTAINVFTYALFWYDKRCARRGQWRVPEGSLLALALVGGSPAAFLAMKKFRHKTKKGSFRLRYWFIVIMQIGLLAFRFMHHVF